SEKYEIRHRDLKAPHSLAWLLTALNAARRDHRALQRDDTLRFHDSDNPTLLCYSKVTVDRDDAMLMVVNLDAFHRQSGWVTIDPGVFGLEHDDAYEIHDLLTDRRFVWQGWTNYVELDPETVPAHVFHVRRLRT